MTLFSHHHSPWLRGPGAIALGALGALSQEPFALAPLVLLMMAICFRAVPGCTSALKAAGLGGLVGLGYFGLGLHWVLAPFQVDPERTAWMAPFALIFLAAGMGLFWALAFGIARALQSGFALVPVWTLAEMLRAYVFTGFPWGSPPQALVDVLAGQMLARVGPHGLMLAMCLLAFALASAFACKTKQARRHPACFLLSILPEKLRGSAQRGGRAPQAGKSKTHPFAQNKTFFKWRFVILTACALFLTLSPPLAPQAGLTDHSVRLVQPNAPQHEKWDPVKSRLFVSRLLKYTQAGTAPDLVVWPETALPVFARNATAIFEAAGAGGRGAPVVLGVLRSEGEAVLNSMVVLTPQGRIARKYDKHHLVPFGEYIPLRPFFKAVGLSAIADIFGAGMTAGEGAKLLDLGPLGKALPLICYEAVFAHDVNAAPARADFLMQLTNDAWFGNFAGPWQHLAQARMRAIEQGLPMVRVANTGISAMIDPYGRVLQHLPLNSAGYLDARLPVALTPTLYSKTGDLPLLILVLSAFFAIFLPKIKK